MSHIWMFSPDSEIQLQHCIKAAGPPEESNKWLLRFGPKNLDLIKKSDKTIVLEDSADFGDIPPAEETRDDNVSSIIEEILNPDYDLLSNITYLQETCLRNPKLLAKLAESIPNSTAEKLTQHILNTKEVNDDFLTYFYEYFIPVYFKLYNSRLCSDILIITYKKHQIHFKLALSAILKDVHIQNTIVNDFVLNLNPAESTDFFNSLFCIELSVEEFTHNLFSIYTAYKMCEITDNIQKYVFQCLKKYSQACVMDKNYGKLLFAFLQHERSLRLSKVRYSLEDIVDTHKSAFRRPCQSLLNELINEFS